MGAAFTTETIQKMTATRIAVALSGKSLVTARRRSMRRRGRSGRVGSGTRAKVSEALLRNGSGWIRLRRSEERTRRSRSSSSAPMIRPPAAMEMACVSSETTTTIASVWALMESAAR